MLSRPEPSATAELTTLIEQLRANPLGFTLFDDRERFLAIVDLDGVVHAVNGIATTRIGLTEAQYLGVVWWQTPLLKIDPSAETTWRTRLAEALADGRGLQFEHRYLQASGERISVRSHIDVVRSRAGDPIGFTIHGENIEQERRTERRLREQQLLSQLTFDQSYQLMAVFEPDGTVRDVNQAIERIGLTREVCVGRSIVDLAREQPDGEERAADWEARLEALRTATAPLRYSEYRPLMESGMRRAVDCTLTPVRDDATGELKLVLYEAHDRTDSFEAEERLRVLTNTVPQLLWISSPDDGVEYFSPRWEEFTGRPVDELLGRGYQDLIHPDDLEAAAVVPQALDGSGPPTVFRLRRRDGEYRRVEATMRALLDDDGNVQRWVGGTLDVTEHHRSATYAQIRQQQLGVALDLTGLGRYDLNFRSSTMEADERFSDIMAIDAAALMTTAGLEGFFEQVEPAHRERVRDTLQASMTRGGPDYDAIYPIIRHGADGPEQRWIHALGRVQFDADGPVRMVGVVEDMTEKRQEDEARVRYQKLEAMGTLASGIAHDFNNVIGAILSYARVGEVELAAGESPKESLAEIARGAIRAGDLTKRLLTFAREEAPRQVAFDLADIVAEAGTLVRPTLPRDVQLDVAARQGLPPMLGDPTQLHQVVVNLITNAGQALADRGAGRIDVSVEQVVLGERRTGIVADLPAGGYLRLRVVDDGPGIPESIVGRVFDPFFTTKGPTAGTGLGLAAVHSIIRNHGGVIAAEPHPGGGAMFTAFLPVQSTREEPEEPTAAPRPGAEREQVARVMFVDDEEALVRLAYRAMPYCDCEVTGFTDPAAAADAFAADPDAFDAVVTDLSMPGMTGLELTERVRAVRATTPVVLTSGYMDQADHDDAQRRGVSTVLPKPCSIDDLAAEVHRLLATGPAPSDS